MEEIQNVAEAAAAATTEHLSPVGESVCDTPLAEMQRFHDAIKNYVMWMAQVNHQLYADLQTFQSIINQFSKDGQKEE